MRSPSIEHGGRGTDSRTVPDRKEKEDKSHLGNQEDEMKLFWFGFGYSGVFGDTWEPW